MRIGDELGQRYRLDERVDGGAMGDVWRGTDTRLNRTVAVKVLHATLSTDTAFRRRFQAEARAAAALRAPGVVDLYDYGEDTADDGAVVCYLVMEFVEGRPLSAVIADRGRIAVGDTMSIVSKCALALDAAHNAGVIHRDVKPGNILLCEDGSIKVVDFGIARAQGESSLTSTGQVMGTVAYVSPDQLYDKSLTGSSDIYSLGVVAYECLAGQKPFQADAPAAVIAAQLHQAPPPLPDDIPEPVRDVVMWCLAKEAQDRPESGAVLSRVCAKLASRYPEGDSTAALAQPNDDVTVRVPTPSSTRSLPEASRSGGGFSRRTLTVLIVAAATMFVVITAAVWRFWEYTGNADPIDKPTQAVTDSGEPGDSDDPATTDDDDWFTGEPSTSPDEESPETPSGSPSTPSPDPTTPTGEPTDDPTPTDGPTSVDPGDGSDQDGLIPGF
ncbi:non-specific serine/threonine protein kinase [Stackebrandtia soli]